MKDSYHHGNLRRALLDEAGRMIADSGPASVSLRELAGRVGVSHAAPAHHFGGKRGVLSALAAEGLDLLADALRTAASDGFDQCAVAYVRFSRQHPAHHAVMYRPELLDPQDVELQRARAAASAALADGVATIPEARRSHLGQEEAALAAWALVHGIATLVADGVIADDAWEEFTLRAARQLFG